MTNQVPRGRICNDPDLYGNHFAIDGAAPHYFHGSDLGNVFVRTQPYRGDCNYMAEGRNELEIRAHALQFLACTKNSMVFHRFPERLLHLPSNSVAAMPGKKYALITPYERQPADWNDGNWMPVEDCIRLLRAKGLFQR